MKTKTLKIYKEDDNFMRLVEDPNILTVAHLVNNHISQVDSKGFFKIDEKDFMETFGISNAKTKRYKSKRIEMIEDVLSKANMQTFSKDSDESDNFVAIRKWFVKDKIINIQPSEGFIRLLQQQIDKHYINSTTKEVQSLLSLRSVLKIPYTQLVYRLKREDHRGYFGIEISRADLISYGLLQEKEGNAPRKLNSFTNFINSNQDTMSIKITKVEKVNNKTYMFYVQRKYVKPTYEEKKAKKIQKYKDLLKEAKLNIDSGIDMNTPNQKHINEWMTFVNYCRKYNIKGTWYANANQPFDAFFELGNKIFRVEVKVKKEDYSISQREIDNSDFILLEDELVPSNELLDSGFFNPTYTRYSSRSNSIKKD